MSDEAPRPATTASIDRRVERLEIAQAETNRAIDRLALEQQHQSQLVNARMATLEAKTETVGGKIDALQQFIQAEIIKGAQQMADWKAMPAGKEIAAEIAGLKDALEKHEDESREVWSQRDRRVQAIETKQWMIAGGLAVIIFLGNIFGPPIAKIITGVP